MEVERGHDRGHRSAARLVPADLQAVVIVTDMVGVMDSPGRQPFQAVVEDLERVDIGGDGLEHSRRPSGSSAPRKSYAASALSVRHRTAPAPRGSPRHCPSPRSRGRKSASAANGQARSAHNRRAAGCVGVTVRLTSPSRSRLRRVSVSMRCDTLGISRRSSLKRFEPSPSVWTTRTVHLSPMRDSRVLMVRHTGLRRVFHGCLRFLRCFPATNLFVGHKKERSCGGFAWWLFSVPQ